MAHERSEQPGYRSAVDVFGLTKQEQASYRVGDARFNAILADDRTTIHAVREDENNYGDFLFVTASRPVPQGPVLMTFYGLGHHEYREEWITDAWYWYQANPFQEVLEKTVSLTEATEMIRERKQNIGPHITQDEPSARGKLFAWLADLTDEDGAYTELQISDGRQAKRRIRPDGFFVIRQPDRRKRLLLELDMRTEDNPRIGREKIRPGVAYILSSTYKQRFGHNSGRWLMVTTGEQRALNMKRQTERVVSVSEAQLFYFTTFDRVSPDSLLTSPIWWQGGKDDLISLIP